MWQKFEVPEACAAQLDYALRIAGQAVESVLYSTAHGDPDPANVQDHMDFIYGRAVELDAALTDLRAALRRLGLVP